MENKRKNRYFNPNSCPVTHFINKIGSKWKTVIIYGISKGYNRFSMLQKGVPLISKQMLVNQLRELEEDGIIVKTVFPQKPPRVEYELTDYGHSLLPLILTIQEWGVADMNRENNLKGKMT